MVASSQELLSPNTCDKELFCRRFVTGDKTWMYHWAPISKLEFMQWKDVDRPTVTRIIQPLTGYTMATVFLGYRRTAYNRLYASWKYWSVLRRTNFNLLDVIKQKHWRKLSLRSLTFSWQCTSAQVTGCSASSLQLWICLTKPSCLQSRLDSQWLFPNNKSEVSPSWNLIYRRWIIEDRCESVVWES